MSQHPADEVSTSRRAILVAQNAPDRRRVPPTVITAPLSPSRAGAGDPGSSGCSDAVLGAKRTPVCRALSSLSPTAHLAGVREGSFPHVATSSRPGTQSRPPAPPSAPASPQCAPAAGRRRTRPRTTALAAPAAADDPRHPRHHRPDASHADGRVAVDVSLHGGRRALSRRRACSSVDALAAAGPRSTSARSRPAATASASPHLPFGAHHPRARGRRGHAPRDAVRATSPQATRAHRPRAPARRSTASTPRRSIAAAQRGKPYRYGSTGPNSFDCSGLVTYVFRAARQGVPRTSAAQASTRPGWPRGAQRPATWSSCAPAAG